MATLRCALEQVKKQFNEFLNPKTILQVCQEKDYAFRKRTLGPVETLVAFCVQVMHGNTACKALRHWLGSKVTDSAYCQARQRLPLEIFKASLSRLTSTLFTEVQKERWHDRRIIFVDGSSCSMPDTPELQEHFGQPPGQKTGCGFPVAGLLVMAHLSTGLILDLCAMPWRQHEQSKVSSLHNSLNSGDVLVADRGFCSYYHLRIILVVFESGIARIVLRILNL